MNDKLIKQALRKTKLPHFYAYSKENPTRKLWDADDMRDFAIDVAMALCVLQSAAARPPKKSKPQSINSAWLAAPLWARWLAMCKDGEWFYFRRKPYVAGAHWNCLDDVKRVVPGLIRVPDWKKSLHKKPKK